jgi:molybdopterin synthase catalytic subunit
VILTHAPIDLGALGACAPGDGAQCLFAGVVRNSNHGRPVTHLEYEAFEEMARPLMESIVREAGEKWKVTTITLVHRLGHLDIGETSVAVFVTSPHRAQAFEACRFVIDTVKAKVPIWKKEFYGDGSAWIEGGRS